MRVSRRPTISGFFPFLNDWGTIGSLVVALDAVLKKIAKDYEVIIVDDGSDKKSKEILLMLKTRLPKVRVITHKKNLGYGGAVKSGIKNSRMELIFYTDGDAQYDPRELEVLLKKLNRSVDIVNGYKTKREDPLYRVVLGRTHHYFAKFLFGIPIRDVDCDFRLMRRSIFDKVELESDSGIICLEMIKKIQDFGFKFAEAPVTHYWRTSGKSEFFKFKRVMIVLTGLIVLFYRLVIKKEHIKNADKASL